MSRPRSELSELSGLLASLSSELNDFLLSELAALRREPDAAASAAHNYRTREGSTVPGHAHKHGATAAGGTLSGTLSGTPSAPPSGTPSATPSATRGTTKEPLLRQQKPWGGSLGGEAERAGPPL